MIFVKIHTPFRLSLPPLFCYNSHHSCFLFVMTNQTSLPMSVIRVLIAVIFLIVLIAFGYLAVTDVPVTQENVTKTLPKSAYSKEE